jgi:hypothetical protein
MGGALCEAKKVTEDDSRWKSKLRQRAESSEGRYDAVESDFLNGRRDFDPR